MAISSLKPVYTIDDDYAFAMETVDTTKTTDIPVRVPSFMTMIEQGPPTVKSEVIQGSSIYINAPEILIASSGSIQTQNFIIPYCNHPEDARKQTDREDGILPAGSRVSIKCPYGSIREIHLD